MAKGVIVQKFLEQKVPLDFFKLAISKNKVAYGYSVLADGTLNTAQYNGEADAEKFFASQEKYTGPALFCFVDYPQGYNDQDRQPFEVLFSKDNNLLVAAYIVGEFNNYAQADSNHNDAYHLVEKFLRPKLKQFFRLCGENIDKLYAEFNTDDMRAEFALQFVGDGCIVLHFVNGNILNYHSKTDKAAEYPWGWTSQHYDWGKAPAGLGLTATVKKGLDLLGLGSKAGEKDLSSAPAAKETGHEAKSEGLGLSTGTGLGLSVISDKSTLIPAKEPVLGDFLAQKELCYPPMEQLKKVAHCKNWYKDKGQTIAAIPDNIDELFKDFRAGKLKSMPGIISGRDRKEAQIEYERAVAAWKARGTEPKASGLGLTTTAVLQSSTASPVKQVAIVEKSDKNLVENLPIITPEDKKWLVEEFLAKFVDKEGTFIPMDPRKIQAVEKRWPAVWQAGGIGSVDGIKNWSLECFQMLEKRPALLSVLAFNLRNEIVLLTESIEGKGGDTAGLGLQVAM